MHNIPQSLTLVLLFGFAVGFWMVSSFLKRTGNRRGPKKFQYSTSTADGADAGSGGESGEPKMAGMAEDSRRLEWRCRETLGVSAAAPELEIKAAYRTQLTKYHPDKVAHLGPEFYELASHRTREIIEAYEYLKKIYAFN